MTYLLEPRKAIRSARESAEAAHLAAVQKREKVLTRREAVRAEAADATAAHEAGAHDLATAGLAEGPVSILPWVRSKHIARATFGPDEIALAHKIVEAADLADTVELKPLVDRTWEELRIAKGVELSDRLAATSAKLTELAAEFGKLAVAWTHGAAELNGGWPNDLGGKVPQLCYPLIDGSTSKAISELTTGCTWRCNQGTDAFDRQRHAELAGGVR